MSKPSKIRAYLWNVSPWQLAGEPNCMRHRDHPVFRRLMALRSPCKSFRPKPDKVSCVYKGHSEQHQLKVVEA